VKSGGRTRTADACDTLDAICYVIGTGCERPVIAEDYPTWCSAYDCYFAWRRDGIAAGSMSADGEGPPKPPGRAPAHRPDRLRVDNGRRTGRLS